MESTKRVPVSIRVARISLFTALAVAGSFVSLPSPVSSVALDSAAGYFCSMNYGGYEGALVFFLGHLSTATVHGFPLGVLHLPIAAGLALDGYVMSVVAKFTKLGATIVGVLINTLLVFVALPVLGWGGSLTLIPYLAVASSVNAALAYIATKALEKRGVIKKRNG
ncbi:hypothetical protein B9Q11_03615 [Candidatus Marsarchaeota G2 archaeon ECH_B_SAG-F08]|jgi:uncharacterized membrane protein|uniref:Alpha-ribazole transporter n=4 Tax=Candidatus Marsarchaeota TaxID=1978152 RepID=A0A2R6AFD9_9ARCH|nr:MAG: hypothetical protein B9Q01_06720 [Candidatus Marsarchaeota G1 archaeon OSP_D]PSN85048.1 MAG: hypothetical protein B9Q02_07910 [Candidatus Marsarchaeota G1 archaeon BE_D]PSN87673.1 MAG: hypothetical protein B9Q00_08105 [Candidatus Marsarchaeota G1 archaeon OSP_C]PSN97694.1 MAG: hypothetical protein B9Q11_03615 [Candidatus Marsarchaeota G2 archaeon ECH_B_SAG-F08]